VLATRALLIAALPVAFAAAAHIRGAAKYDGDRALDAATSAAEAARWAHETTTRELAVPASVIASGEVSAEIEREIPPALPVSSGDRESAEPPSSWQIMTVEYGLSQQIPRERAPSPPSPDFEPNEP
jgi:hypothetical protein